MLNFSTSIAPEMCTLEPATRRQVADAVYQLRDAGVRVVYVPIFEQLEPYIDAVLLRWQDDIPAWRDEQPETDLFIAADLPRSVVLNILEQCWSVLLAPEQCEWIEHTGRDGRSLQMKFGRTQGRSSESRTRG